MNKRKKSVRHGKTGSGVYQTWVCMMNRCYRPNNNNYKYYGNKGIRVCNRWKNFLSFYADMGDRPDGMSLDRIDRSKGYFKENCRWATKQDQMRNMSSNRCVWYQGERYGFKQLCDLLGLKRTTVRMRVDAYGKSLTEAFGVEVFPQDIL